MWNARCPSSIEIDPVNGIRRFFGSVFTHSEGSRVKCEL